MAFKLRYSEFKHLIDIDAFEEAIGFTPIETRGSFDSGYCIFPENHKHGDTTGKFAIERNNLYFNCFVCGGGDLLSLAMLKTGLDVEEATTWLYQFTKDDRSDQDFADELLAMLEDAEKRVATLPFFNETVLDKFDGPLDYFLDRGISEEVAREYGLRYSETAMKVAPVKKLKDGTVEKNDSDYVGPASIWPHYWQDRLVGWQYRWTDWDEERTRVPRWLPKWTNTSDFPKESTLFNYDYCLKDPRPPAVVESLGTTLFCRTYGYPAVCYFGSKPSPQQLRLLRRFTQGVILAPDNDSNMAGDKVLGSMKYLERFIPVFIAEKVQPEDVGKDKADGLDLNDYAHSSDPEGYLLDHLTNRISSPGLEI